MSKKINFIFKFSKTRKSFIMFFVCWRCWWIIPFITFWTFCKFTDIFISGTCCWFMAQPSWTTEFRANMSRTHFLELTRFLRLDNKGTREKRKSKDNFAAIRGLFKEFNVCLQDASRSLPVQDVSSRETRKIRKFIPCNHSCISLLRLQNDTIYWLAQ